MKVIGYARVSTTKQELFRQRDKIKKYCDDNEYFLCDIIEDFGISGKSNYREGYQKLLTLSSEDCDLVVISEISRLSRQEEITETLNDMQQIIKNGLSIVLLDNKDKVYIANEVFPIQDLLLLTIQLYGAAQERKDIRKKNQDGKVALFKRYPYIIVDGNIPYGYRKVYDTTLKRYIIEENKEESDNVRKAFQLILEGNTLYKTAKYFNDRNITFKKMPATVSYLSRLLRSDLYRGIRRRTSEEGTIEQRIEPIISEDDFLRVGKLLGENHKYVSNTRYNPLKGIIRCRCGKAMMIKDKTSGKSVYRCSNIFPKTNPYCCTVGTDEVGFNVTNTVIRKLFLQRSVDIAEYYKNNRQRKITEAEEVINGLLAKKENLKDKIEAYNIRIKENQQKLIQVSSMDLSPEFIKLLDTNHKKLMLELEGVNAEISNIDNAIIEQNNLISQLSTITETSNVEEVYRTYLDYIEYYPHNIMKGTYKVVFKSGLIIYIIANKVRAIRKAYILTDDADINLETGDITFKYRSGKMFDCQVITVNIHDIFTTHYIDCAAFVEMSI